MNAYIRLTGFVIIAVLLRVSLIFSSYQREIGNRVEVSTPITSWKRAVEGVTLMNSSISPYIGDTFHESPIFLKFYYLLIANFSYLIPHIFILCDVITALLLSSVSYNQLNNIRLIEDERIKKLSKTEDKQKLSIKLDEMSELSAKVAIIYLLSPYSLMPCIAQSTGVFTNLLMSSILLTSTKGYRIVSIGLLALLSYQSFYPIMMIIPVTMIIEQHKCLVNSKLSGNVSVRYNSREVIINAMFTVAILLTFIAMLLYISFILMDRSLEFLSSTYYFLWTVPDLTPTIGIFWYFFTEMFDHFRDFFLWTFQINAFIYVIPLALTLRKNTYFLSFILLILLSLFKPYPTISDFAIYTALLPQWTHLFSHMKQGLIIACMFISCSVLAPILWHLWIIMGTANSNFYFGVTLAYNTAQIFLLTDLLFAFIKREYYIDNGIKTEADGKLARLELAF